MMHAFEEGIIPYIIHIVLNPMPNKFLSELEIYMDSLLTKDNLQLSEHICFSRINFTQGLIRLTLLMATDRIGALMAVVIIICTPKGHTIMSAQFELSNKNHRIHI